MNVVIIVRPDEPPIVKAYALEIKSEIEFAGWKAGVLSGPTVARVWHEKYAPAAFLFATDDPYPLHGRYATLIDEIFRWSFTAAIGVVAFDDAYRDIRVQGERARLVHWSQVLSGFLVQRFLG